MRSVSNNLRRVGAALVLASTLIGVTSFAAVALHTAPPVDAASCTPGYTPCIPNKASDVDCASGSGNGPRYTKAGAVYTVKRGMDRYGLDPDRDGKGCERN